MFICRSCCRLNGEPAIAALPVVPPPARLIRITGGFTHFHFMSTCTQTCTHTLPGLCLIDAGLSGVHAAAAASGTSGSSQLRRSGSERLHLPPAVDQQHARAGARIPSRVGPRHRRANWSSAAPENRMRTPSTESLCVGQTVNLMSTEAEGGRGGLGDEERSWEDEGTGTGSDGEASVSLQ